MCDLRKTLDRLCVGIETIGNGYRIVIERHDVDSAVFEDLTVKAQFALEENDPVAVVRNLRHALSLWRGEALHDLAASSDRISAAATRLNDKRLTAVDMLAGACIRTGQDHMAIEYLRAAIAGDPLHERLWGHLMLALYRVGRRAEALATYQQLRTLVIDNLGVSPCREVAEMHQRILAEDEELAFVADWPPRAVAQYVMPTAG
jgi:DNA-binding SARP family transcriptional activator